MTENLRETNADQEQRQAPAGEAITVAVLVDVVGDLDWHRGFQFRRMRAATADDLRAELARLDAAT